jgi:hypothetical protein
VSKNEKLAWWRGSTERRRFHRLDLEDLVDMPDEQVAEDATDEEIFKAVQQMRNDRENMEINGGDDSNGGSPQVPKPMRKRHCRVLQHFVGSSRTRMGCLHVNWSMVSHFRTGNTLGKRKNIFSTSITDYFMSS